MKKTNAGSFSYFTAEELKLPPLPPGFVFAVVPQPTNSVETIPHLFDELYSGSLPAGSAPESGIKRFRTARLNGAWSTSRSGKFVLNLFDDVTFTAVVERTERVGSALVRICRLEGQPKSRLIVAEQNGVLNASLFLGDEARFAIRYHGNGLHKISERDPLAPKPSQPQCVVDLQPIVQGNALSENQETVVAGGAAQSSEPPIIDIMIIYTPATKAAQGGLDGVSTWIALAVAEVNEVLFVNSLINARLRLIHQQEVQYTESGDSLLYTDYLNLTLEMAGLEGTLALGNAWGADLISLFVTHPNAATSRGDTLTIDRESKYSVVIARYATSIPDPHQWHFAHELGHNLGCAHYRFEDPPPPRYFPDSYGNPHICGVPCGPGFFTDIMFDPSGARPYYSNPDVSYTYQPPPPQPPQECPTGIAEGPCACDCAGTINFTASIVAAYETPTFMSAPRLQNSNQDFVFDITGPANASCRVESSSDFINWTLRTTVTLSSQGVGTYTDTQAGSAFYRFYRIRPLP